VNPAVAVVPGSAVLDEPLPVGTLVSFPLVLLVCVLATRRSGPASVAPDGEVLAAPALRA